MVVNYTSTLKRGASALKGRLFWARGAGMGRFTVQIKENAGGNIRTQRSGKNGVENRGVFARSWYFGGM